MPRRLTEPTALTEPIAAAFAGSAAVTGAVVNTKVIVITTATNYLHLDFLISISSISSAKFVQTLNKKISSYGRKSKQTLILRRLRWYARTTFRITALSDAD